MIARARALALALAAALSAACGSSPGDDCAADGDCGELVCLKPSASATKGICTFAFLPEGSRCLATADCAPGTFCTNDLSTTVREREGVCRAAQGQGASCLRNENCASPLRCRDAPSTGGLGVCKR